MSCWIAVGRVDELLHATDSSERQALNLPLVLDADQAPDDLTRQSLAARALLAQMLKRLGFKGDSSWRLGKAKSGKPGWQERHPHPWPYLSFSHSGEVVAAAMSSSPVGIDVERVRERRNLDALIQEVCSDDEQAMLCDPTKPDALAAFYSIWTLKEAWLKAEGEGIFHRRLADINTESSSPDGCYRGWVWQCTQWSLACCSRVEESPSFLPDLNVCAEHFLAPTDTAAFSEQEGPEGTQAMRPRVVGYAIK